MMVLARVLAFGTLGLLFGVSSTSAIVTVAVQNAAGNKGGTAQVDVDVTGLEADGPAGNVDFDLLIDGDVFDIADAPDCTIQLSGLNSSAFFPASQPDPPMRRIRFSAADLNQDVDPLSVDGTLWSCNLPVAADAADGPSDLVVESTSVFDLLGLNELESEGLDGVVTVQDAPAPTATSTPIPATNTPVNTATPRATNTSTPAPTRAGGGDDDDGCQVVAPANSSAGWLLLIPAAALLWHRRRSR